MQRILVMAALFLGMGLFSAAFALQQNTQAMQAQQRLATHAPAGAVRTTAPACQLTQVGTAQAGWR